VSSTYAIIVCDHGLGHVRRCALMAKQLERSGEHVTIFAPLKSLKRLQRSAPSFYGLNVYDFSTGTTPSIVKKGLPDSVAWLDRLPCLKEYSYVICDNLPEILVVRPDAIISAQFFWHDVIEGVAASYSDLCQYLLTKFAPTLIGCDLFAMDSVRELPGFRPVGLYKLPELAAAADIRPVACRTDLLVSGGSTPAVQAQLELIIQNLVHSGPMQYARVHIDPLVYPVNAPPWMFMADYSVDMFCSLKAGLCRPGLGILTDLLTVQADISCVYEKGNTEMMHNARVVERLMSQSFS
jgi:hypothetical protein